MYRIIVAAVAIGALLTGCASTPKSLKDIAKEQAEVTTLQARAQAEQRQQDQQRMEAAMQQVPAWALDMPQPDASGVYAVGMGEADRLRLALRKAMLDAEFGLAKLYRQELSGSERAFTQDSSGDAVSEQYTALIDKLVSAVPVVGFQVIGQEVKPIDGLYHAFVLLKLPYDEFNRVLQSQRRNEQDKTIRAAFDDLERRLEKRRQQDRAEQERIQQQVLEAAEARRQARSPVAADGGAE